MTIRKEIKLAPQVKTYMESITTWFKKESDALYLMGEEDGIAKGEEKKTLEFIKALLLNTNHTIHEIAKLVNAPEALVLQVKESL